MENASKALIIAGAILISIILISVGIMVVQSAGGLVDTGASQMNQQEIQAFNTQFLNYSGSQKGSTVRTLIQTVISNNATYKEEESKQVSVNGSKSGTELSAMMSKAKASTTYNVEIKISEDTGLVSEITVPLN